MKTYKHFATVSSQVYFCSSPIRLDSYNRCQFGCTYCFSRNRSLDTSLPGLKVANAVAFRNRLARIEQGCIQSAFDEFLASRVPIQLGGLQDPFSGLEKTHGTTLELLETLSRYNYPTIISTKSLLVSKEPYLSLLKTMNVLLRFSAAGVRDECRHKLELGCPKIDDTFATIDYLAREEIAISVRVQPVIPGHEDAALGLARRAASAGAKHVSFEYLKIGTEEKDQTVNRVSAATGENIWEVMTQRGIIRIGRDYTLTVSAKCDFVRTAKQLCHDCGVRFGAGDTEFIHLSDGQGCCNGSGYFLKDCTQFRSNFVGVLSGRKKGDRIHFSDLESHWQPRRNVHAYLTTDSRGRSSDKRMTSWISLIAHRWNGGKSPYSPAFFFGIEWKGDYDNKGYKIYEVADAF
jgi:DNA repair photolyase